MISYPALLTNHPYSIAEKPAPYSLTTERHLQALWYEQKYFLPLQTADGEPITVLSPGIWNLGKGPDFCKAHLKIGNREYRGDVEIHFSDEDWTSHRHHEDSHYDQVILHLSLWTSKTSRPIQTSKGRPIPKVYLENSLTIAETQIPQIIDLDLYPYEQFLGSGKCAQQLFDKLPDESIQALFRSASEWRLTKKREYLTSRIPDNEWLLAGGIVMALGYKHNTEAFLDLFLFLLPYRDLPEKELHSLSLGVCGFFEPPYQTRWTHSPLYQELLSLWGGHSSQALHQTQLRLEKIRPLNHPIRRLAYLAKLLSAERIEHLYPRLAAIWNQSWQQCLESSNWTTLRSQLQNTIPTYPDPYWNTHYLFDAQSQTKNLPLIGNDLRQKILINTFFPLLHGDILRNASLQERDAFLHFYHSLTAEKNSKTRYLTHRFFGNTPKGSLLKQADMEQGAYQLHRDFCLHFEASCLGCPFIERFNKRCG